MARGVGSGAGVEVQGERGARRAVEAAADVVAGAAGGEGQGRVVLQDVGAGVRIAGVVGRDGVTAQVDAEQGVGEQGVAADGVAATVSAPNRPMPACWPETASPCPLKAITLPAPVRFRRWRCRSSLP